MLIAATLIGLAFAGSQFLEVFPPHPLLDDKSEKNGFKVRLTAPVDGPTNVHFGATGLKFESCYKTFTPENWNQYQLVKVRGATQFTTSQLVHTVDAKLWNNTDSNSIQFQVSRKVSSGATCASTGDPHVQTFTNSLHTYHGGTRKQVLFHSKSVSVQVVTGVCNSGESWSKMTCNKAVSIRYGKSAVALDVRQGSSELKALSPLENGFVITGPSLTSQTSRYDIDLPDGVGIEVMTVYGNPEHHLNIRVTVPAHYQGKSESCKVTQSGGLCNMVGGTQHKYYPRGGRMLGNSTANMNAFYASWDTKPENDMLNGVIGGEETFWKYADFCKIPVSNVLPNIPPAKVLPPYATIVTDAINDGIPFKIQHRDGRPWYKMPVSTVPGKNSISIGLNSDFGKPQWFVLSKHAGLGTLDSNGWKAIQVGNQPRFLSNEAGSIFDKGLGSNSRDRFAFQFDPIGQTNAVVIRTAAGQVLTYDSVSNTIVAGAAGSTVPEWVIIVDPGKESGPIYPLTEPEEEAPQAENAVNIDPDTPKPLQVPAAFASEARNHCNGLFIGILCARVVNVSPYVESCLRDSMLTGDYKFAEGHKQAFMQECRRITNSMRASADPKAVTLGIYIQQDAGLGDFQCINSCSKAGECTTLGCTCNDSFYGLSCEKSTNGQLTFNGVTWDK